MLNEPRPFGRVPEVFGRPHHRGEELPGVVGSKPESVALLRDRVVVADAVGETTRRSDHRDRPVSECDQRRQSAGLEARGHPQHVRARIDALRHRRVEADDDRDLAREL